MKTTTAVMAATIAAAIARPSLAVSIMETEIVVIGDKEWAQVDLFTNLTWNAINVVCPAGSCGAGTLNGFDMEGWLWASQVEVGDNLFMPFTSHPGGRERVREFGDTYST